MSSIIRSILLSLILLPTSIFLLSERASASVVLSCAQVFSSTQLVSSPLFQDLMKAPLQNRGVTDPLSNLGSQPEFTAFRKVILTSGSSSQERRRTLGVLKIGAVIAAPGHRLLRNPKQIDGLVQYISSSAGGNFQHDPLLLNVVTGIDGRIRTVDLWNAHHRLVAYMKAGYLTLSQIPAENLKILINGVSENGEMWGHFLSIAALDPAMMKDYSTVPVGGDIRPGTVSVDGRLTNFELGSRNTIGQLFTNTFSSRQPKIGILFGTFDPVHEGHISTAKSAKQQFGLDEVILIANPSTPHKPSASSENTRTAMLKERLALEEGVNLYVGDAKQIVDQFGRDPIFERISQIYGTKSIYQVIGSDSFGNLVKENKIKDSNRSYIVFPRELSEVIPVPDDIRDKVEIGKALYFGVSSTGIRNALKQGERPEASILHPVVVQYILSHHLYGVEEF